MICKNQSREFSETITGFTIVKGKQFIATVSLCVGSVVFFCNHKPVVLKVKEDSLNKNGNYK